MKYLCSAFCFFAFLTAFSTFSASAAFAEDTTPGERPNILWLTCEDTGRHLGAYGFPTAETPNLDRLAARGLRYTHAWSNYPVCAPARTTIITGCYPASLGAEQMRSFVPLPKSVKLLPAYLRENGYYCTNNVKEDYNVFSQLEKSSWDVCSGKAHWKNRKSGTPFFSVFNFTITHESRIRDPHVLQRDPAKTPLPKYHPDTPEVRRDWAQYHDRVTEMDVLCGAKLDELQQAGLSENTIVFFFGDHGSGMPRNKRTPLDCGLGVPMLVYYPPKFQHLAPPDYRSGAVSERLVSFVDLAPTVLSLAGIRPPAHMQGVPFAGKYIAEPRKFLFGFRGRMDERADLVRSVSDGRYVYVRNFHPEIIYGAKVDYMFDSKSAQIWQKLYQQGKLPPEQDFFWELKPTEELYDLKNDPDEVSNLADSPEHREMKERLQNALKANLLEIRDVHFLPENMLHERFAGSTPYEMGHDPQKYPFEKIQDAAYRATDRKSSDADIGQLLSDAEPAVRYWGSIGILVRLVDTAGPDGTTPGEKTNILLRQWKTALNELLQDQNAAVRIVAAESMGRYGDADDVENAIKTLLQTAHSGSPYTIWLVLSSFDAFAPRCKGHAEEILALSPEGFTGRIETLYPKIMNSVRKRLQVK